MQRNLPGVPSPNPCHGESLAGRASVLVEFSDAADRLIETLLQRSQGVLCVPPQTDPLLQDLMRQYNRLRERLARQC